MARALDLHVVGEGVETADQRALLAELGCPAFQGYLESRPRPAGEIMEYLAASASALKSASTRVGR